MNTAYENALQKSKDEDDAFITVGELRAHLEGIPDSASITLGTVAYGQKVHYLAITTNFFPVTLNTENKSAVTTVGLCEVHVPYLDE